MEGVRRSFTCIVYLNRREECSGGTAFFRFKKSGSLVLDEAYARTAQEDPRLAETGLDYWGGAAADWWQTVGTSTWSRAIAVVSVRVLSRRSSPAELVLRVSAPDARVLDDLLTLMNPRLLQASPIVVIGMHRSGTRVLVEILDKLGVFMGADLQAISSPSRSC
jgi:hypothetical protein